MRQLDERSRDDMRDMAYDGNGIIMLVRRYGNHARVQARDELMQTLEMLGRRVRVGAQNPVSALEKIGAGAVDAVLLRTCHGVARHVIAAVRQNLSRRRKDMRLRGKRVGNDAAIIPIAQKAQVIIDRRNRRRQDDEVGTLFHEIGERLAFGSAGVRDPPARDCLAAGPRIDVDPEHLDVGVAFCDGGRKRRADKPQPDHGDVIEPVRDLIYSIFRHALTFFLAPKSSSPGQQSFSLAVTSRSRPSVRLLPHP